MITAFDEVYVLVDNLLQHLVDLRDHQNTDEYDIESDAIGRRIGAHVLQKVGIWHFEQAEQAKVNEKYIDVERHYRLALVAAECLDIPLVQGQIMGNLSDAYRFLGRYELACDYAQQALRIARDIGDQNGEVVALLNLGQAKLELGHYDEAIQYTEMIRQLAGDKERPNQCDMGRAYVWEGVAYMALGQMTKARQTIHVAGQLLEGQNDIELEAICHINLANVYATIGDYDKAIHYSQIGLMSAERGGLGRLVVDALITLGNSLTWRGLAARGTKNQQLDWDQAFINYGKAEGLARKHDNVPGCLLALINQAALLLWQRRTEEAAPLLEISYNLALTLRDHRAEGFCYLNRAAVWTQRGEQNTVGGAASAFDTAIKDYNATLKLLKEVYDDEGLRQTYGYLGDLYSRCLNDYDRGQMYFEQSIELWEKTRDLLLEEHQRIEFLTRALDTYDRFIRHALRGQASKEGIRIVELVKSRTFLELLSRSNIKPPTNLPIVLCEKEEQQLAEIGKIYATLARLQQPRQPQPVIPLKLEARLADLINERRQLLKEIEKQAPDYIALRRGLPLSYDGIIECLCNV